MKEAKEANFVILSNKVWLFQNFCANQKVHNVCELILYNDMFFIDFLGEKKSNIFAAKQAWLLSVCNQAISYLLFRHASPAWPQLSSTEPKQNVSFSLEIKIFKMQMLLEWEKVNCFLRFLDSSYRQEV